MLLSHLFFLPWQLFNTTPETCIYYASHRLLIQLRYTVRVEHPFCCNCARRYSIYTKFSECKQLTKNIAYIYRKIIFVINPYCNLASFPGPTLYASTEKQGGPFRCLRRGWSLGTRLIVTSPMRSHSILQN